MPPQGRVSCLHAMRMYTSVLCQTFNHVWNLLRCYTAAGGIAFTVLLFREAGGEGERKEERKRYDSDVPLATFHPAPILYFPLFLFSLLSLLSTKVCSIHKGLIAITAAAPSSACLSFALGTPSLFSYSPESREAIVMGLCPQALASFCICFCIFCGLSFSNQIITLCFSLLPCRCCLR